MTREWQEGGQTQATWPSLANCFLVSWLLPPLDSGRPQRSLHLGEMHPLLCPQEPSGCPVYLPALLQQLFPILIPRDLRDYEPLRASVTLDCLKHMVA